MEKLTLVIGNRNYSSWSMRGWLVVRQTGADFDEIVIPLDQPESKQRILEHSPAGLVPILKHGALTIWDSLAIAEYLAELFPQAGLWPEEPHARAKARAVVAEMHSGFVALRIHMPMDCRAEKPGQGWGPGVREDVDRIISIWERCRESVFSEGPYLFGSFGVADAFYAPVISRFRTYNVEVPSVAEEYMQAVWSRPELQEWLEAARTEPWTIMF